MSKEEQLKDPNNVVSQGLDKVEDFYKIFYTKEYDSSGKELRASDLFENFIKTGDASSLGRGLNISLEQVST